jgi:hypothetical protein
MLEEIPREQEESRARTRPEPEILEELVETVRAVYRMLGSLNTRLELFEALVPESRVAWKRILNRLLERKQRASETIFREALAEGLGSAVVTIKFPEEMDHLVELAKDPRYLEPLRIAIEDLYGSRPDIHVKAEGE